MPPTHENTKKAPKPLFTLIFGEIWCPGVLVAKRIFMILSIKP